VTDAFASHVLRNGKAARRRPSCKGAGIVTMPSRLRYEHSIGKQAASQTDITQRLNSQWVAILLAGWFVALQSIGSAVLVLV
jgi:hypothetical protein